MPNPPSEDNMRGFGRYGFRCVQCRPLGIEVVVLLAVFLAQAVYISVGVMLQVRTPQKVLLRRGPSRVERHQLGVSGDRPALDVGKTRGQLPEEQLPSQDRGNHEGGGRDLQEVTVGSSDVQQTNTVMKKQLGQPSMVMIQTLGMSC